MVHGGSISARSASPSASSRLDRLVQTRWASAVLNHHAAPAAPTTSARRGDGSGNAAAGAAGSAPAAGAASAASSGAASGLRWHGAGWRSAAAGLLYSSRLRRCTEPKAGKTTRRARKLAPTLSRPWPMVHGASISARLRCAPAALVLAYSRKVTCRKGVMPCNTRCRAALHVSISSKSRRPLTPAAVRNCSGYVHHRRRRVRLVATPAVLIRLSQAS